MTDPSRDVRRQVPFRLAAYILREVVTYTLLGLTVITVIFLARNLLRFLDELTSTGFSAAGSLALLRCLIPILLSYTLPIAFLFGVLLATTRMASDLEITAMRASGLGLRDILLPVVGLGFAVSCACWYLQLGVEHVARRELRNVAQAMSVHGWTIEPGRFERLGARVLYVDDVDGDNHLERILISDRTDPKRPVTIFAESGRYSLDPEGGQIQLRLESGAIHIDPDDAGETTYQRIAFRSIDYRFDVGLARTVPFSSLRPGDMTLAELREIAARADAGDPLEELAEKNPAEYRLHFHRRFALPVAPTLFALAGVLLGLRRIRGARSWGAMQCSLLTFVYYLLLKGSESLALRGVLPAGLAIWIPNLLLAGGGLVMLVRARRAVA